MCPARKACNVVGAYNAPIQLISQHRARLTVAICECARAHKWDTDKRQHDECVRAILRLPELSARLEQPARQAPWQASWNWVLPQPGYRVLLLAYIWRLLARTTSEVCRTSLTLHLKNSLSRWLPNYSTKSVGKKFNAGSILDIRILDGSRCSQGCSASEFTSACDIYAHQRHIVIAHQRTTFSIQQGSLYFAEFS
jgi:hypothetical protein